MNAFPHDTSTLRDHVHTLRRHAWILLAALVLVPVGAVGLSYLEEPRYTATAEVLLTQGNVAALLDRNLEQGGQEASRLALTQARLAQVPTVVDRTLEQTRENLSAREFVEASDVVAVRDTDILEFRVTDRWPERAARLASAFATQFTIFRRELDTLSVRRARAEVRARIAELRTSGARQSPLYNTLLAKDQQLATIQTLQTSNAFVVKRAESARKTQPMPVRNGLMGLGVGLFLGILLALLRDALDTRVHSPEEIGAALELPLLARLPSPPRRLRSRNRLVMLERPEDIAAEGFRTLRANLEFATLGHDVKTIAVTSALEGEGKSTTCANLAVAFARAGKRVVLVDLDLRRPIIHRFFDRRFLAPDGSRPGLTNLALGHVSLDDALQTVAVDGVDLHVLFAGPLPPGIGEFVASEPVGAILEELRARSDIVLIDVPPLLQVGDVITLSHRVDAALIVARPHMLRKRTLAELRRVSKSLGVHLLGYVITGADAKDVYGYGYGYGHRSDHDGMAAPAGEPAAAGRRRGPRLAS